MSSREIRPNRIQPEDREGLFALLEEFVNLDPPEHVSRFLQSNPDFFHGGVNAWQWRDRFNSLADLLAAKLELTTPPRNLLELACIFRAQLQVLWESKDKRGENLDFLLGIGAWRGVFLRASFNPIRADWSTGRFIYEPAMRFQAALYALFQQSWRARICRLKGCHRYFIAGRQTQMYCSVACAGEGQRDRKAATARKRRGEEKSKKQRAKKSQRKRGK